MFWKLSIWSVQVCPNSLTLLMVAASTTRYLDTSKNTKATSKCCVLHSLWGLISSLHNSIHLLEKARNPLKMACSCPCGRVIRKRSPDSEFVSVRLHDDIPGDPRVLSLVTWQNEFVRVRLHNNIPGDPRVLSLGMLQLVVVPWFCDIYN